MPLRRQLDPTWARRIAIAVLVVSSPLLAIAQTAKPADQPSLADRQQSIHERVQRLEATMLKLSKLLGPQEPDKAERLRGALEQSGKDRIRARVEELVALLRSQDFADADRKQEALLGDLEGLLQTLTSRDDELQRRREERQRLEKLKRTIRVLMEDQTQSLYHTQHADKQMEPGDEASSAQSVEPSEALAEQLRRLERLQRDLQRRADDVNKNMQPQQGKPGDSPSKPTPGNEQMQRAADQMRQAGDRLSESKPGDAKDRQQESLDEMQKALDELDDALRQTRKDEIEQTLDALQTRLQQMLQREQEVAAVLDGWLGKDAATRGPDDFVALTDAAKTQQQVTDEGNQALALMLDEGSTIIVPELLRQMVSDMTAVRGDLNVSKPTEQTRKTLRDVIDLLTELLDAIDKKREDDRKQDDQQQQPQQQQQQQEQTLLPKSAELKMLRSSQMRLNQRTPAADESATVLADLSARQRRLSELTRQMHERKQ